MHRDGGIKNYSPGTKTLIFSQTIDYFNERLTFV